MTEIRCICGPDITGEDIDERPDCPVHGEGGTASQEATELDEEPF